MSDLFHDDIADEDIAAVFGVMAWSPQHTFQVLTKRPERMQQLLSKWTIDHCWSAAMKYRENGVHASPRRRIAAPSAFGFAHEDEWPLPNVWLGVSVEDQRRADERIPLLRQTPAATRWLSMEPLLEHVNLDWRVHLDGIGWVVVGGESGPGARPCDLDWIHSVLRLCVIYNVPCFVKQLGSKPYDWATPLDRVDLNLEDRKGGDMSEWPPAFRVREFPFDRANTTA